MRPAPQTFDTKLDATAWLKAQASDVERGMWALPEAGHGPTPLLRDYANQWLADRDLTARTRQEYRKLLDQLILSSLGDARIDRISPTTVRSWYATLNPKTPTRRAHAYGLLRTIMNTAYSEDRITANPCRIRGAGQSPNKAAETVPATMDELVVITSKIPEQWRLMVPLAAWCALRFGELTELRRSDIDLKNQQVWVRRGVTYVAGVEPGHGIYVVGDPKTQAGKRPVKIPPHLIPMVEEHLAKHTAPGRTSLLFPSKAGGHLHGGTFARPWQDARAAAGRPDLRFHDLRHTGAVLAALTGATLKDLMKRLGHATPNAAMRYQHAAEDRDAAIAKALSEFAVAKVIPLKAKPTAS